MEMPYRGTGNVFISEAEYQCDLYFSENNGGIALIINVRNGGVPASFIEIPLELSCLCGQLSNGFKFTLINLRRYDTQDDMSAKLTKFCYSAEYIFCGIGDKEQIDCTFNKVEYTISDIVEWGGDTVYTIGENYELSCANHSNCIQRTIFDGKDYKVNYSVIGSLLPVHKSQLLREHIIIDQQGIIEIEFTNEVPFNIINEIFLKVKRLIEISVARRISIEKINALSSNFIERIGEDEVERPISVYGCLISKDESSVASRNQFERWYWINLSDLMEMNSFGHYFEKYEKLDPIIELFVEPLYIRRGSTTHVFLNIIQALETYHSRFVTNDFEVFKKRVNSLVEIEGLSKSQKDSLRTRLMANSKNFITLESRLADLLYADSKIHFDIGEISEKEFPSIIAHSRHYYTHYDEKIKNNHRVLSLEELQIYIHSLLKILEYYILKELGLSDNMVEIREKLRARWGNVFMHLQIQRASDSLHSE